MATLLLFGLCKGVSTPSGHLKSSSLRVVVATHLLRSLLLVQLQRSLRRLIHFSLYLGIYIYLYGAPRNLMPIDPISGLQEHFGGNSMEALRGGRHIFVNVRDTPCLKPFGRLGGHRNTTAKKAMEEQSRNSNLIFTKYEGEIIDIK